MGCSNNEGSLRSFLEISYDQLEELNLEAKERSRNVATVDSIREYYIKYLTDERRLKAVTVCFTDMEGRLHMLDYDKKFLLKSFDNLTFDGSSIRGFTAVKESDLRLSIDWGTFRWLPSDVFGPGKVLVFGLINDRDGSPYNSDMRYLLKTYSESLYAKHDLKANIACEVEGFLFEGQNAEQNFSESTGFKFVSQGGYYNALPCDPLKLFIDRFAEAKRALGFENEKDHPEVAPSQFELNYTYTDALMAADQVQLYKLVARQVASHMGFTASFLPKPLSGINGSGMHINVSLSKGGQNIFFDGSGEEGLSAAAWSFVDRVLSNAEPLCLALNPSVNAYRRLDPHFEAPNQISASAVDRTSMIRIPLGNQKSARVEVRTVAPDANPYLGFYTLIKAGLEGEVNPAINAATRKIKSKILPSDIYSAMEHFATSTFIAEAIGEANQKKYVEVKRRSADRCPRELGTHVKTGEVLFHHEVTNQSLWGRF